MEQGLIACIPMIVLVAGALITKKIAEMMIAASVLGAVLVYKSHFFTGYIEMIYGTLSNPTYQFVLIILLGFGAMIRLFQESGALSSFGRVVSRFAQGPKKPLITAWIMALFLFVDDYLNTLAIAFSMREVTDKNGIPREHLAYQVTATSASLCVLIPFTSWTSFTVGLLKEQGMGFSDYISSIPFMFFPIIALFLCLLVAVGIIPKIGLLKDSYTRVQNGGPVMLKEKQGLSIVDLEMPDNKKASSILNFIIPVAALVAVVLLYDNDLVHGLFAAIFVQGVLYTAQKIMTPSQFITNCFEGAKSMGTLAMVIFFSYILNSANQTLGFSRFLIDGISNSVLPQLLPVLIFVIIAFTTFATSGYWVIQVITIPIFIPLSAALSINPHIIIAALMSGVMFGSICCFYSDVIFMASAGTGVANIRQVKVSAPYILINAVLTIAGYLITGFILL